MSSNTPSLQQLLEQVLKDPDLTPADLPNLDLYMDQIITLFDNKLHGGNTGEKPLTKTMINNYSKERLIKPIKGKKYSREQLLQILLIYVMKQSLTMQQIKKVLSSVTDFAQEHEDCLEEDLLTQIYLGFLAQKNTQREQIPTLLQELNLHLEQTESPTDLAVLVLSLCAASNYFKRFAQVIIETYFSGQDAPQG